MEEALLKLIEVVEGLAPEVWAIMLRQVEVSAWVHGVWSVVFLALTILMAVIFYQTINGKLDGDIGSSVAGASFLGGFAFFTLFIIFVNYAVTRGLNPPYYAIQLLSEMVK